MRVAIDAQLAIGTATGIGEYVSGLLPALSAHGVETVALDFARLDPWRFDRRVLWDQVLLPLSALGSRCQLLHCTAGTLPLAFPGPIVATVHDVAWLRSQQHTRAYARWYFGRLMAARYPHARRILVDSAFSRDELTALVPIDPHRVDVVYPGVAAAFAAVARDPDPSPMILAVGTVERRKNLEVAIAALAAIPEARLIVAGPPTPYLQTCRARAEQLGVAGRVVFRGYVTRDELLTLYARATLAVVPSRYEGFGYGVAQALVAGVPVIAARASSLPEVAGGAAILCDPDDVGTWSAEIAGVLADRDRAQRAADAARATARARFSWASAAAATASSYAAALVDG